MLISVVTPTWNAIATIDRAIKSVQAQTWPWWEMVVVDDCSADGTWERLTAVAQGDARIRVLRMPRNEGPSAARNRALALARGDWIAYLDADDEFYPDYLETVAGMSQLGDVLVFGYDVFVEEYAHPPVPLLRYRPSSEALLLLGRNVATPLGVAHKRHLLARSGLYDPDLWCLEDWELWQRFARCGAVFVYVDKSSGRYYIRSNSRSRAPRASSLQAEQWSKQPSGFSLYPARAGGPLRSCVRVGSGIVVAGWPEETGRPSEPAIVIRALRNVLASAGFAVACFPSDMRTQLGRTEPCDAPGRAATEPLGPTAIMQSWFRFLRSGCFDAVILVGGHPELEGMAEVAHAFDRPVVLVPGSTAFSMSVVLNVDYIVCFCGRDRVDLWNEYGIHAVLMEDPVLCSRHSLGPVGSSAGMTVLGCGGGQRAVEAALTLARSLKSSVAVRIDRGDGYLATTVVCSQGGSVYTTRWQRVNRYEELLSGGALVLVPDHDEPWCPRAFVDIAAQSGVHVLSPSGCAIRPPVCGWLVQQCLGPVDPDAVRAFVTGSTRGSNTGLHCSHGTARANCWPDFLRQASRQPGPPCIPRAL